MTLALFTNTPAIIAALHLPDPREARSAAWLEDYVVQNAQVFAKAGIPWVKVQDQTRTDGLAASETIARMAALTRLIRAEVPSLGLGIIIEAHDPKAALSVAAASGADFVRLKVFVGGAMTAFGPRHALAPQAMAHRAQLGRDDIAILADVHDRTAVPLSSESQPMAATWAVKAGADGLVITGSSFPDTQDRIAAIRKEGVSAPILIGGGVTTENVTQAIASADGVVVSSSLMRKGIAADDPVRWDGDACARFMDAARTARAA
jgi:predicted TIM-barrel enzyme